MSSQQQLKATMHMKNGTIVVENPPPSESLLQLFASVLEFECITLAEIQKNIKAIKFPEQSMLKKVDFTRVDYSNSPKISSDLKIRNGFSLIRVMIGNSKEMKKLAEANQHIPSIATIIDSLESHMSEAIGYVLRTGVSTEV